MAEMKLPCTLDEGGAPEATIGVIVLQSDETLEAEMRAVFSDPGVALYHARIPSAAEVTPDTLKQMEAALPRAAALLPAARPLDVVGYGCTSGATIIGADRVSAAIRQAHPGAKTTDPVTAVMAACAHLGIRRLGLVTPYVAEVSRALRNLLEENGYSITAFGSFEQIEDATVARITTGSVCDAICALGSSEEVDAVFVSCTNLRSFSIIDQAESIIGKPVITSNQAFAWHMRRLAGLPIPPDGPGRLFYRESASKIAEATTDAFST